MAEKEYIERGALIAELQEELEFDTPMYTKEQNEYVNRGLKIAIKDTRRIPAADVVEVRHGEWIDKSKYINGLYDPRFDCSVCGHIFWHLSVQTYNYCPACGAKMDGERKEQK